MASVRVTWVESQVSPALAEGNTVGEIATAASLARFRSLVKRIPVGTTCSDAEVMTPRERGAATKLIRLELDSAGALTILTPNRPTHNLLRLLTNQTPNFGGEIRSDCIYGIVIDFDCCIVSTCSLSPPRQIRSGLDKWPTVARGMFLIG